MTYFVWDSSFNIGVDVIDQQHRRIVDYINRLDEVQRDKNLEKLQQVVSELVDYTLTHFIFEEELLEKANYPFISAHKKVHEAFKNRVSAYQERLNNGEDISKEVLSELRIWLTNHIKKDDRDYSSYVIKILKKSNWITDSIKKLFGRF